VPLRVIDLFSGCGGLSLGFRRAGFNVTQAFDNWQPAVQTYRQNFDHPISQVDLREISDLDQTDVIVGGPPCQGFSSAGMRRGSDSRNTLVSTFSLLIAKVLPRAFVFENVEGFLTGEDGKFVFELLEPLVEAGYRIHLRKVNTANYGVPQHRKRVLAIGGLDWDPSFPEHTHSALGAPGAHLNNRYGLPYAPTLADAISDLPPATVGSRSQNVSAFDHSCSALGPVDRERIKHLAPGQRMRDLPEELWHDSYKTRANRRVSDGTPSEKRGGAPSGIRRLRSDEPSKAITGAGTREFIHPTEDRTLTIRECARLQTFPDNFTFSGTNSEKIQQIGNAVPPMFALAIAKSLRSDLLHAKQVNGRGSLLSFHPTSSQGMSPILQKVWGKVEERFAVGIDRKQGEQCL
jgi:DNA (cytosine-5)-methyltransferase 1